MKRLYRKICDRLFSLNTAKSVILVTVAALVLAVFSFWAWWHYVRSNPERTFYAAVSNSMRTTSVSKRVVQETPGSKLEQDLEVVSSPGHVVRADTVISQDGETKTAVRTESISTPREDYVRYNDITTDQKSQSSGKVLDFSELAGVWGKTEQPDKTKTTGELYGETTLGVVPIGNVPANKRVEIMDFVRAHEVYKFDASKTERKLVEGRPTYVYKVQVSTEAWVGMLKRFGRAMGLTQLEDVDPANYRQSQPIEVNMTVDVWSRQFKTLAYPGGGRTESLGGYGLRHDVNLPEKTVPVEELQRKLRAIE